MQPAQQVIGCNIPTPPFNPNPTVCTFPGPLDTYPEGPFTGTPAGCCPGDNACFPQALVDHLLGHRSGARERARTCPA